MRTALWSPAAPTALPYLLIVSCFMPGTTSPRSASYPFARNDPRAVKVAPSAKEVDGGDVGTIEGDCPPGSWGGTLMSAYPPEELSLLDAPVYVGQARSSGVHLFFIIAEHRSGDRLECRLVFQEGLPQLATAGAFTSVSCQPVDGPASFDVVPSGNSPRSSIAWGPLPPETSWAIISVGDDEYRAQVRGGYAFLADLPVHWGERIAGRAFGQDGEVVHGDAIELPPTH